MMASNTAPFPEVKPYPTAIEPAMVLDELAAIILRYVVMDKEQADATVLWIVMTWVIDILQVAPIAIITAPEKACGKSQLLTIVGYLVFRPLSAANSTSSFLFRAISVWGPTVLIDEADTFIRGNDELKGLVNAGHTRANAFVGRTVSVGDGHEPQLFPVWGAKAFAGISLERHLPDSTMSRGIVFVLRRKLAHESVERLRHADRDVFEILASKLARFASDFSQQVRAARPTFPENLSDRTEDNWEPLFAIAQCAGPAWVERATAAALKLSADSESSASTGNELLADIEDVFTKSGESRIRSSDLIRSLVDNEEGPWATYNRGKQITPRQISKQLAAYGIKSKTVRMGPHDTPKGYDLEQFKDAFARYLSPSRDMPQPRNDSPEAMPPNESGVADLSATETDATPPPFTF